MFFLIGNMLYMIETIRASQIQLHNYVSQWSPTIHQDELTIAVRLEDKAGKTVATGTGEVGTLSIPNATLWWPFSMVKRDSDAGYLYTLVVSF